MRRVLQIGAYAVLALAILVAAGVWLFVRDEVAAVRAISTEAGTPPPKVSAAVVAVEGPWILDQTPLDVRGSLRASMRALNPLGPRVVSCAPTMANRIARLVCPRPTRPLRWHVETAMVGHALSRFFTPEELLAVYLHRSYLGRVDGQRVTGVEEASMAYFGKPAETLSLEEAATIAALMRSPSVSRLPERALERRNLVLKLMLEQRLITGADYQRAVAAPLRLVQST